MLIDCISDVHGYRPELPGGDLLIFAGDLVATHRDDAHFVQMCEWLDQAPYDMKVVIAGNHDGQFEKFGTTWPWSFYYLCDGGIQAGPFRVWGAPWTLTFGDWFFEKDPEQIKEHWDLIPEDTDILVTHSPPFGILDRAERKMHVGCKALKEATNRVKPKLHVFGHIHECSGKRHGKDTTSVNASYVDERYRPRGKIERVVL